jgi:hypothetical protein
MPQRRLPRRRTKLVFVVTRGAVHGQGGALALAMLKRGNSRNVARICEKVRSSAKQVCEHHAA